MALVTFAYSILVTFSWVIVEFRFLSSTFRLLIEEACHMKISIARTANTIRKMPATCEAVPPSDPPAAIRNTKLAAKSTIRRTQIFLAKEL